MRLTIDQDGNGLRALKAFYNLRYFHTTPKLCRSVSTFGWHMILYGLPGNLDIETLRLTHGDDANRVALDTVCQLKPRQSLWIERNGERRLPADERDLTRQEWLTQRRCIEWKGNGNTH